MPGGSIQQWAFVPRRFAADPAGQVSTIFTGMFMHGGWLHLFGNMLFLYVFGRSIEDRFGHFKFLFMYFFSGLGGAVLHIFLNAGSRVPSIGASGAIAGILGAYFVTFPRARITTLIPLFFFFWTFDIPALLILGLAGPCHRPSRVRCRCWPSRVVGPADSR